MSQGHDNHNPELGPVDLDLEHNTNTERLQLDGILLEGIPAGEKEKWTNILSAFEKLNPRLQHMSLAQAVMDKLPIVLSSGNTRRNIGNSQSVVEYKDQGFDTQNSDVHEIARTIKNRWRSRVNDQKTRAEVLQFLSPDFLDILDEQLPDEDDTIHTLRLPADALDEFTWNDRRLFANWLYRSSDATRTRIALYSHRKRAFYVHEDAKYALCMLIEGKMNQFCLYVCARPEMIQELVKFKVDCGIFTYDNIPKLAAVICQNYVTNANRNSNHIRLLSRAVYAGLRGQFALKVMKPIERDEPDDDLPKPTKWDKFHDDSKILLSNSQSCIPSSLSNEHKAMTFGLVYGTIQGAALQHTGYIQHTTEARNKLIAKSAAGMITAGITIPGLFCAHFGGILLMLLGGAVQPWLEAVLTDAVNKVIRLETCFTELCHVVKDQLTDLKVAVEENLPRGTAKRLEMERFIEFAHLGLQKGMPEKEYRHRHN